MNELALFAGAGGGILGGHILGWRTRCAVEVDPYARAVLLARQRDGCLPRFPIWDDVRTFDGRPWRGSIDIVTGGFPCQDISAAGKGVGITGERSGLWREMARTIGEVRPRYAWVENSPMLVGRGLAVVLGDLAEMGYDARWGIVGADDAWAPHGRKRIWILAYTKLHRVQVGRGACDSGQKRDHGSGVQSDVGSRCGIEEGEALADAVRSGGREGRGEVGGEAGHATVGERREPRAKPCDRCETVANSNSLHAEGQQSGSVDPQGRSEPRERPLGSQRDGLGWWSTEPHLGRMVDGLASPLDIHGAHAAGNVARVGVRIPKRGDRLRCIGNGQVPAALVLAWRILNDL